MIRLLSVAALPLIFAITLHEAAHGWVANRLGDPTAKQLGRLTANPIPHIDPIGTVLVPLAMLALSGFIFGWAKPVPVNIRNFRDPRKDMALVAVAGPVSNLLMALFWGLIWKAGILMSGGDFAWFAEPMQLMGRIGMFLNLILMVLNLLPLPPLDGGRVLSWLVPTRWALALDRIEPYGIFILLGLLFLGLWPHVIGPATDVFSRLIKMLLQI
ncbi:MAG: site-2 protease family protein [Thiotrichales bacterium]